MEGDANLIREDAVSVSSMAEALRRIARRTENRELWEEVRQAVGLMFSLSEKIQADVDSRT